MSHFLTFLCFLPAVRPQLSSFAIPGAAHRPGQIPKLQPFRADLGSILESHDAKDEPQEPVQQQEIPPVEDAEAAVRAPDPGAFSMVATQILEEDCPRLEDAVAQDWTVVMAGLLRAHAMTYVSHPLESLQAMLISLAVMSSEPALPRACPQLAAEWFSRASDLAASLEQYHRGQGLARLGNLFHIRAMSRWYNCLSSEGQEVNKTDLCIGVPENRYERRYNPYQQVHYSSALVSLHTKLGLVPPDLEPPPTTHRLAHATVEVHDLCVYPPGAPLPQLATTNHKLYADIHGYQYFHHKRLPVEDRDAHFSKLVLSYRRLAGLSTHETPAAPPPDILLWIDCDAFFTDLILPVEAIVYSYGEKMLGPGVDGRGEVFVAEEPSGINTGVMIFQQSNWTLEFLQRVIMNPHDIAWDQSMMLWEIVGPPALLMNVSKVAEAHHTRDLDSELPTQVRFVHQSHLNAYLPSVGEAWHGYGWQKGDFIKHFAGCPWDQQVCMEDMMTIVEDTVQQVDTHKIEDIQKWHQLGRGGGTTNDIFQ
ncbi:unnamed protein product [Vitrella brassicaformis CCMP3155]|uniref:Nucleotide-diphospho-sugar transferase domain-containing protein n=1 Tax=Vitrella brassicaformis (strain CCMP3155) TaxID=1169540 RepID=A0A0G4EZQ3_VITBC|nr:unnamed protein product [Vitrella brassicaformis CCMP3155]|eukprot:CEM04496.1 unnamed protein product [Vitrella brassicaformis CCMP3155]